MNQELLEELRSGAALAVPDDVLNIADPATELHAAKTGCVAVLLNHLAPVHIDGEDSAGFLHNLLTSDVHKLAVGSAQHSALCSAKGRILANFLLWREADGYSLRCERQIAPELRKKLTMYVLRSRVRVREAPAGDTMIGIAGPRAPQLVSEIFGHLPEAPLTTVCTDVGTLVRRTANRFEVCLPAPSVMAVWQRLRTRSSIAGSNAWRALEIADGIPVIGNAHKDEFVPQMANLDLLGAVSFQKGCYPGQEIVARTQYLGRLKRRLYRARVPAGSPVAEAMPLYAPDLAEQACGMVVNCAPIGDGVSELLAVVQISSVEAGEVRLGSQTGARLEFLPLPYPLT